MTEPMITIRRAETPADYVALQHAQRRAWGLLDDSYVVPVATMVGVQHHGGLVLGAFLPDGEAVGLSFAFLGQTGGRWCLYSQLTGVIPEYQGKGLGARMKELQRDHVRSIGLGVVAWSFDPLQARNAHFNLRRLGATASRYIEDMYGPRTDDLNRGVPTDRLIAEWPVEQVDLPVEDDFEALTSPRLVEGPDEPTALPFASFEGTTPLLVEIPAEIARLRVDDPARAERWRAAIAGALTPAFAAGYVADDVVREAARLYYVLRRG
jgi:predicted GNAT superfamily acetyltransferase